jgi:hypothetical protein
MRPSLLRRIGRCTEFRTEMMSHTIQAGATALVVRDALRAASSVLPEMSATQETRSRLRMRELYPVLEVRHRRLEPLPCRRLCPALALTPDRRSSRSRP